MCKDIMFLEKTLSIELRSVTHLEVKRKSEDIYVYVDKE